jgi:uncharacterized protein YbaR (Trm112 family)
VKVVEPIVVDTTIHNPVELVSEGEIRNDERGYADYKPTRPYHDRVSSLMFSLQYPADSRRPRSKQDLTCQRCGERFEGRKGQKYCPDCVKPKKLKLVEEESEWGELGCEKAYDIFVQLRLEWLLQKHGVTELDRGMELDVVETKRLTDLAVYMVNHG